MHDLLDQLYILLNDAIFFFFHSISSPLSPKRNRKEKSTFFLTAFILMQIEAVVKKYDILFIADEVLP